MVGWAPEDSIWSVVGLPGDVKCFDVDIRVVGRIVTAFSKKIKKLYFLCGLSMEVQFKYLTLVLVLWLNRG